MQPHRLMHRVAFQKQVTVRDPESGARVTTWQTATLGDGTDLGAVPAEVLTGPGREPIAAGSKHAEADLRVNLRWFPGLDASWRVVWDGKPYNITSIETDKTARREYRLRGKGGMSDGS